MRWVLRVSGSTRRGFSRLPHWVKDAYDLVSYVNFVELVPTIVAIAIAPRHFFRRLPRTLEGKCPHYKTPIKFFANFAALFLMLFFLRHGDLKNVMSQANALWALLLVIPLTPPAMIILGIISWGLYQAPRLAPNGDAFPATNHGPFKLLIDPRTYFRLDWRRFFWGLFYIGIYFLAAWQIVQVLIAANFLAVVYLVDAMGEGHFIPKAITILLGIAMVAFCIHGLVLHPYMELLRASLRHPARAAFEADVHEIRQCIREFLAIPSEDTTVLDAHATVLHEVISAELQKLQLLVTQQNIDFELSESDVEVRLQVHRSAFQVDALREHLQYVSSKIGQKFDDLLAVFEPPAPPTLRRAA